MCECAGRVFFVACLPLPLSLPHTLSLLLSSQIHTKNTVSGINLLLEAQEKVAKIPPLPAEPLTEETMELQGEGTHYVNVPWKECKDELVFELFDEDLSFEEGFDFESIGTCKIPIRDLIQNFNLLESSQPEIFRWYSIKCEAKQNMENSWFVPQILIRAQIMLRESENDEGFDSENQEKKSMLHLFSRIKTFMRKFNDRVDGAVSLIERIANVMNWTHPSKSRCLFLVFILLGCVMLLVPLKVYLLFGILFPFTGIFRSPGGLSFKCMHLLSSLPDRLEQSELIKCEIPTPVECLPRLYGVGVNNTILANYFRYSCVRLDNGSKTLQKRVFCTLSVDGSLRLWINHDCATFVLDETMRSKRIEKQNQKSRSQSLRSSSPRKRSLSRQKSIRDFRAKNRKKNKNENIRKSNSSPGGNSTSTFLKNRKRHLNRIKSGLSSFSPRSSTPHHKPPDRSKWEIGQAPGLIKEIMIDLECHDLDSTAEALGYELFTSSQHRQGCVFFSVHDHKTNQKHVFCTIDQKSKSEWVFALRTFTSHGDDRAHMREMLIPRRSRSSNI